MSSKPEIQTLRKIPLLNLMVRDIDNVQKASDWATKKFRDTANIWGRTLTGTRTARSLQMAANLLSSAYLEHLKDKEAQSQAVEGIMARLAQGML